MKHACITSVLFNLKLSPILIQIFVHLKHNISQVKNDLLALNVSKCNFN